jgi:hypothetical protein
MAPETLERLENEDGLPETPLIYGVKSDVWSFGVLMWEMFTGCSETPYYDWTSCELRLRLLHGERLIIPPCTPDDM